MASPCGEGLLLNQKKVQTQVSRSTPCAPISLSSFCSDLNCIFAFELVKEVTKTHFLRQKSHNTAISETLFKD